MPNELNLLDSVNTAFGVSYRPVAGEDPMPNNIVKLEFSVPFFSAFLWTMGKHAGAGLSPSLKVRAILSTSIVGLPFMLAADVVASLTTQVANAVFANSTN